MRLTDRIAVITGAASGIGKACALLFSQEGAKVAALDKAPTTTASFSNAIAIACDVASLEDVRKAAQTIRQAFGKPDIIVNCAAATVFADTLSTSAADFRAIMEVNLLGVIYVCQTFVPDMLAHRYGSIVNLSSITGILGAPGLSAYSASKGAVITLTRTMALELAESKVRVNCVCPASVDTPMLQASFDRAPDPELARALNIKRHPLGRLGTPDDVANLVLFLASDEASWITGGTYVVDGGAIIARRWQE